RWNGRVRDKMQSADRGARAAQQLLGDSSLRIAILAILLAVATPVPAVDLRGVQLGQSCQHAVEVELSLGTQPRSDIGSMLDLGILAFEDQSIAGRNAQYLYRC